VKKYRNIKTTIDGIIFDSKREAARYFQLKLLERAGELKELKRQVTYRLEVNGQLICKYIADFEYISINTGELVTEDLKGFITPEFKLKAKLFKAIFGREIYITK
jgi:hypothetical protein